MLASEERWGVNGFGGIHIFGVVGTTRFTLLGSNFTFFESGNECARSRLDRFFIIDVDSGWSDRVVQQAICKFTSDHMSILLSLEVFSSGPLLFRFFNARCDHPELCSVFKELGH